MDRKLFLTEDGSHSLQVPALQETYHSKHGAIQESQHVFIKTGLETLQHKHLKVFEMGFGTGLNAFLSYIYCKLSGKILSYTTLEKYPLSNEESILLNYPEQLDEDRITFDKLHTCDWDQEKNITPDFAFKKIRGDMNRIELPGNFDIIFYDAFGPEVQPDLWTPEIFSNMYNILNNSGLLVTYSAKGQVRRNLQNVGFSVERLPGPPGKREMLRAIKSNNEDL